MVTRSYTNFIALDTKFYFTCGELNLHGDTVNGKNIISLIKGKLHVKKKIVSFWKAAILCCFIFRQKIITVKISFGQKCQ